MGTDKVRKGPSKLKGHETKRVGKQERIRREKEIKRKEKKAKMKEKIEREDELNPREQDEQGFYKVPAEFKLDQEDEKILSQIGSLSLSSSTKAKETALSSMIQELDQTIEAKTKEYHEVELLNDPEKNEKIRIVYKDIAEILSKYRYGKFPKALQVVPMTANAFQLLKITEPDNWTPHAYYELTKMFSVAMSAEKFRIYLNDILMPMVRKDIKKNKKLNYHLYSAMKRSFFKPASWFRGILFPLCEDAETSIREAELIASIIVKKSIPAVHSAIAILKLTQMPYSGATNILLDALVRKKYALPRSVISALYDWIMQFDSYENKLPVVWFQTVLHICQAYGKHFTPDQVNPLKAMVKKKHKHIKISPEIIRVLVGRGDSLNVTMVEDSRMVY